LLQQKRNVVPSTASNSCRGLSTRKVDAAHERRARFLEETARLLVLDDMNVGQFLFEDVIDEFRRTHGSSARAVGYAEI
jgi:hypothetical protein